MKNILFLTNFAEDAPTSYHYALVLAQHFTAAIHFAHIGSIESAETSVYPSSMEADSYQSIRKQWSDDHKDEDLHHLKSFAIKHTPPESRHLIGKFQVRYGDRIKTILSLVNSWNIDLIIRGMSQLTKLKNTFFAPVSLRLIDKARCPILLTPQKEGVPKPSSILFTADFSSYDQASISFLTKWADAFSMDLHILHLPISYSDFIYGKQDVAKWQQIHEGRISRQRLFFHMINGVDDHKISSLMKSLAPDILCLSTYARGFWGHLLYANVKGQAEKLDIPILVIKPNTLAAPE